MKSSPDGEAAAVGPPAPLAVEGATEAESLKSESEPPATSTSPEKDPKAISRSAKSTTGKELYFLSMK